MSATLANPGLSRRSQLLRLAFVVALFSTSVFFAWPHVAAWIGLQAGKARLDSDPAAARADFEYCLAKWPDDPEVRIWAARAARQSGDASAALRYLDDAARLGGPRDAILQERLILDQELQVLERQTRDLMAEFRWPEAAQILKTWLASQPDSAIAWKYRAQTMERLRDLTGAAESLRRAIELVPSDQTLRLDLARILLEQRQNADEAAEHVERVLSVEPANSAALILLASAREAQGRTGEAIQILDRVMEAHPNLAKAIGLRGRIELNRGSPAAAADYLRRAAKLDPSDEETLYSLVLALTAVGAPEEIEAARARWRRSEADLRRVRELARAIAADPANADLRSEIGELFLRNARETDGLRWLESALSKDPRHLRTRRLLAEYYEGRGDAAAAKPHRAILKESPNKPMP